ncbi:DNA polymerase III subunit delta [Myxococcaceae bacterium]|nr:DNA polymerase III subunit delta [Myxococcaceae bacterium]
MTPGELERELASGTIRSAYLLAGDQALLREESWAALRAAVLAGAPAEFNLDRLEGAETSPARLRDSLRTLPVLAARRLVWLREPEAGRKDKGLTEALAEIVAEVPEGAVLVVTAGKVDRRARWVKAFAEPRALVACEAPASAPALVAFIAAEAKRRRLELGPGVAELLAERVGPELLALRHELEKAALQALPATRIERAHLEAGLVTLAEEPVWDLTDAIGEGRVRDALPLLVRLLDAGTPPQVVLGTLASHFRKLLRVRHGASVAAPPFVAKKLERQSRRFAPARLAAALRAIHDADLAIKGAGGLPPAIALERLVLGLAS